MTVAHGHQLVTKHQDDLFGTLQEAPETNTRTRSRRWSHGLTYQDVGEVVRYGITFEEVVGPTPEPNETRRPHVPAAC
eukprot:29957-Eustigmatos_ZCMA.PRE.1